ncbi:MAG: hypothetical protein ACRCTY_07795, partial [Candidatus Adiutrix sp.]
HIHSMKHRHINDQTFTLPAIDDIISRGNLKDWCELRDAFLAEPHIRQLVYRVCQNYIHDDTEHRYHFWALYGQSVEEVHENL